MIKRYTVGSIGLAPLSEGDAVLFTDYESARKEWEAKEKALRELAAHWPDCGDGLLCAGEGILAILNEGEKP